MLFAVFLQLAGAPNNPSAAPSSPAGAPAQQTSPAPKQEGKVSHSSQEGQTPGPSKATNPERSWFKVTPMPATTGAPGVFTVESAEVLPKGVWSVSAYANKFGRAPGSATILAGGFDAAVGITDKIMVFGDFEPYRYINIGEPSQLSLRMPPGCSHDVYKAPIYCGFPAPGPGFVNSWHGPAAGYVLDFPYAAYNTSGEGPVMLGAKMNFWSETRGDPVSVSLGTAFFIPTASAATELREFGTQSGALNYSFTLGLSKTLWNEVMLANNVTYLVTGNPKIGNETLYTPGDEIIFGQGFIFRPQHRLQFLMEYTAEMVQEGHAFGLIGIDTENTSLGPSDPVDGNWGVRWYFANSAALDVGYRYMLNLHQLNDRNGFTIKL
ncbi:MAG TPA: hypothetical protein VKV05_08040, partial [Terriglobales bacterium]|nr:hypothetical protein [Terriglobales bacterium]